MSPQSPVIADPARGTGGSIWSDCGRIASDALAIPLRTASTVVNAGVFGAYYVSTLAVFGLALTGGAISAPIRMSVDCAAGKNPDKSLSEYVISPARTAYNFISRFYYELPAGASEKISAGVAATAVVAAVSYLLSSGDVRCAGSSLVYVDIGNRVTNNCQNDSKCCCHGSQCEADDDSYLSRVLRPYKISTDIGGSIINTTTQLINSRQPHG